MPAIPQSKARLPPGFLFTVRAGEPYAAVQCKMALLVTNFNAPFEGVTKNMSIYRNLFTALAMLFLVTLLGVAGYSAIEGWALFDSLYMTVITIATVGYGETHPLSPQGRMFTIVLILLGSGVLVYAVSVITAFIVEGDLSDALRGRKMKKRIDALQGHVIVCGDSGTGKYAIEEMLKTGRPFVVVEQNPVKVAGLTQRDILCVGGGRNPRQRADCHLALGRGQSVPGAHCQGDKSRSAHRLQGGGRGVNRQVALSRCRQHHLAKLHRRFAHGFGNRASQCGDFSRHDAALKRQGYAGGGSYAATGIPCHRQISGRNRGTGG